MEETGARRAGSDGKTGEETGEEAEDAIDRRQEGVGLEAVEHREKEEEAGWPGPFSG
jgi:hypothetical protein